MIKPIKIEVQDEINLMKDTWICPSGIVAPQKTGRWFHEHANQVHLHPKRQDQLGGYAHQMHLHPKRQDEGYMTMNESLYTMKYCCNCIIHIKHVCNFISFVHFVMMSFRNTQETSLSVYHCQYRFGYTKHAMWQCQTHFMYHIQGKECNKQVSASLVFYDTDHQSLTVITSCILHKSISPISICTSNTQICLQMHLYPKR